MVVALTVGVVWLCSSVGFAVRGVNRSFIPRKQFAFCLDCGCRLPRHPTPSVLFQLFIGYCIHLYVYTCPYCSVPPMAAAAEGSLSMRGTVRFIGLDSFQVWGVRRRSGGSVYLHRF